MNTHSRKSTARYAPLLTQAQAAEQRAFSLLADARQRVAAEVSKLAQLQSYGQQKDTRSEVLHSGTFNNRQAFMMQLKTAVTAQENLILKVKSAEKKAYEHWLAAHQSTERYLKLIENERARQRSRMSRIEQKELDEIALRSTQANPLFAGQ